MSDALAIGAIVLAVFGLMVGLWSAKSASDSSRAAVRSAEAAEASNLLASQSVDLQRAQATATEADRRLALEASLDALRWEGRVNEERGIHIQNVGRGTARDIQVIWCAGEGSPPQVRTWPSLSGGGNTAVVAPPDELASATEIPPSPDRGFVAIRLAWTNEDGTLAQTKWQQVRRFPSP